MNEYDVAQLARLEPAYQERLGLTTAPFPPTHEDRFLYLDSDRLQYLKMLQHLTEYSNLLLLIIGERGIGKTSLMRRFLLEANPDWQVCQIDANTMMGADQLLYQITQGFGLATPPRDSAMLQDALYQQLVQLQNKNQEPILIIDDAHELPLEALEALFLLADVEGRHGILLRILMFCEPLINTTLDQPEIRSLRDRVTHSLEMPHLTEEQTAEYIHHRLTVAGMTTSNPFTVKDIHHIYKLSDGVPAKVNETCHILLNENEGIIDPLFTDTDSPDKNRSFSTQYVVTAIILLLLVVLFFQDEINNLFNAEPKTVAQSETKKTTPSTPPAQDTLVFEMPENQPPAASTTKDKPVSVDQLKPDEKTKQVLPEIPTLTKEQPAEKLVKIPAPKITITSLSPSPIIGSSKPQTIILKGNAIPQDTEVHVQWSTGEKTLLSHQVEWLSKKEIRITFTTGVNTDHWQVLLSNGSNLSLAFPFEVLAAKQKSDSTNITKHEKNDRHSTPGKLWDRSWINQQPGHHLTLQLLASQNKNTLTGFVQKHSIKDFAVAFETQKNQKPLYVLILGSYPDRAQATRAITQLPASLKSITPWIRNYKSIQLLLNKKVPSTTSRPVINLTPPVPVQHDAQTAWLWGQDPRHYTLQLMSGKNESAIKSYIKQNKLEGKAVYFKSYKDHQSRFVLIFGSYPNRTQALSATKSLPDSIQNSKPWARTFASIHSELPAP
jgi:septal ring-binding cell division protein DamX/type II secretory pathway predicted ATPase ExeA